MSEEKASRSKSPRSRKATVAPAHPAHPAHPAPLTIEVAHPVKPGQVNISQTPDGKIQICVNVVVLGGGGGCCGGGVLPGGQGPWEGPEPGDPTSVPIPDTVLRVQRDATSNYPLAVFPVKGQIASVTDSRIAQWNTTLYCDNTASLTTDAWRAHVFFFHLASTAPQEGYCVMAEKSDKTAYRLVKVFASNPATTEGIRTVANPLPAAKSDTYALQLDTATRTALGKPLSLSVKVKPNAPVAGKYAVVMPASVDTTSGVSYSAQGKSAAVTVVNDKFQIAVPESRSNLYYVFLVESDPTLGRPAPISNVLAVAIT